MNQYQQFYVYTHREPDTEKVVYVGMGTSNRAWLLGTGHRSAPHRVWLTSLLDKGYLPYDWVWVEARGCTKEEARQKEIALISKHDPKFNKHKGIGSLINPELIALIKTMKNQGKRNTAISDELNVSKMTVWRYLNVY